MSDHPRALGQWGSVPALALAALVGGVIPAGSLPVAIGVPEGDRTTAGSSAASPLLGKSVRMRRVWGVIRLQLPGSNETLKLRDSRNVPVGTTVDVRAGRVELVAAAGIAHTTYKYKGEFSGATFTVSQERSSLVHLELTGGDFAKCGAVVTRRHVRSLWSKADGLFRTRGRYSASTVRGTIWRTEDLCNGTRTFVIKGAVRVRDFVLGRSVTLGDHPTCRPMPGRTCPLGTTSNEYVAGP